MANHHKNTTNNNNMNATGKNTTTRTTMASLLMPLFVVITSQIILVHSFSICHHHQGMTRRRHTLSMYTNNNNNNNNYFLSSYSTSLTKLSVKGIDNDIVDDTEDDNVTFQTSNNNNNNNNNISFDNFKNKHILVVGGSGRVGGSVVCNLLLHNAKVTVGGTNVESFQQSKARWKTLYDGKLVNQIENKNDNNVSFSTIHREDASTVINVLQQQPYDLVIHTAGPFQGKVQTPNGVIDAAIQCGVPYIDVCDDYCTASMQKERYSKLAIANDVPCIISTGCWPGVSSLMAKQLTTSVLLNKNQHQRQNQNQDHPDEVVLQPNDLKVDFSFFTAGSGGAGSTLLVATFLILAEKSLMIVNGRRREVQAMKEYTKVNFGPKVGDKNVAHLNLLETASIHDVLGIGNVETLFGTAPEFWNTLLGLMAQLPSSLLSNEPIMEKLALFSLPIVRVVDYFAGATNAMKCVVTCDKDETISEMALYAHENLEPCVGECVVAFGAALLSGGDVVVKPGVHFPEEAIDAGVNAAHVLRLASVGAHTLEIESNSGLTKESMWGVVDE